MTPTPRQTAKMPKSTGKTPKSGRSKFKRLRKRLQYKIQGEKPPRAEDAAVPEENKLSAKEEAAPQTDKKTTNKQKFNNRASPMKIVRLYKHQNDSQRHIISLNGFESFLNIKCSKLHPGLCNFLMDNFNIETCELEFPGRGSIPITDTVVQNVLGLPMGKFPVVYKTDEEAIAFVMATLGFSGNKQPKLSHVEAKLKQMELGDPTYFMMWVLYVICSMLAPTTGVFISPKSYPAIMDPTRIKLLNWCRFVIVILIETAKAKGKNAFKACMCFMMIKYIDSLETRDITVTEEGPRICAWDNKSVARAIAQDTKTDGTFGKLPLKKCFRKNKVLMLSTPAKIEKFVKANVPANCCNEEMSRYIAATQDMYIEIDAAVANFLKKISSSKDPAETFQGTHQAKMARRASGKKQMRENIADISSSSDDNDDCDGDYIDDQSGHTSDHEGTSLDDESFSCKDNKNGTTVSALVRKKCSPTVMQSRWCCETSRAAKKAKVPFDGKKGKEQLDESKSYKDVTQMREPPNLVGQLCSSRLKRKSNMRSPIPNAAVNKKSRAALGVSGQDSIPEDIGGQHCVELSETQRGTISTQGNHDGGIQVESTLLGQKIVAVDPLEQIRLYGSDSQSSNDALHNIVQEKACAATPVPLLVPEDIRPCLKQSTSGTPATPVHEKELLIDGIPGSTSTDTHVLVEVPRSTAMETTKGTPVNKKSVSWADHVIANTGNKENEASLASAHPTEPGSSTVGRRPVTRSCSPLKDKKCTFERSSPVTRSISSANPLLLLNEGISPKTTRASGSSTGDMKEEGNASGKGTSNTSDDNMSRKLDFGSIDRNDPRRRWLPGEAGNFDLGFDDSPEAQELPLKVQSPSLGIPTITSSNEDEFYGPAEEYEKLWAMIDEGNLQSTTQTMGTSNINQQAQSASSTIILENTPASKLGKSVLTIGDPVHDPESKTPVPQAHQKRLIKPPKNQMSPFVSFDNKKHHYISKSTLEIYNAVCKHGVKKVSKKNNEVIIDYGTNFIYLYDLADSVAPSGWLSNSTCEIGLHVLSHEMAAQKKYIMPLYIASKLREGSLFTKEIKKYFSFSETNRLDHKEQIMFPVLQNLCTIKEIFVGHYYLINLNLKAERFEIMDSLRKDGDKVLLADSSKIINTIKSLWSSNYKLSNIKIANYETVYVQIPRQLTRDDCGYFMLKSIECWDGRRMTPFIPVHMPKNRMLYTTKWLEWGANKIQWGKILFDK